MISIGQLLERIFPRSQPDSSRTAVKRRLKVIVAHDRSDLSPAMMEMMQQEILEVVSRYVELDTEGLNFALESNQRVTSLTANLPIRRVRPKYDRGEYENGDNYDNYSDTDDRETEGETEGDRVSENEDST